MKDSMVSIYGLYVFGKGHTGRLSIVLGFLLACSLGFPAVLRADEIVSVTDGERYHWHVKAGMQFAHQNPDFTYEPVKTSDMSAWNENPDRALIDFSFVSLQRDLTGVSNLELSYCRDGVDGTLYGKKSMPFLFLHLPVTLRVPLEMELRRLKLQYSRILLQPGQFSLGVSVGAQALQIWMDADMPNLLSSMGADDHLDYLVVVPSVGAFAEYQTNGPLKYRIVSEYLSAPLKRIQGKLIGVNAGVDYRLSDRFFLGLGYRFSDIDIRLHQRRYDLKGSYEVHGYEMRAGFDF